jgi:hypothetical protein
MREAAVLLAALLLLTPFSQSSSIREGQNQNYEFVNGRWFDGSTFRNRSFYAVGGVLTSKRPKRVDSVIDLKDKFVIPPFGEAHNHNVGGANVEIIRKYLEDGIFYVKNPNVLPRDRASVEAKINIPESIDVAFANGGLTASEGHPIGLARRNIARAVWTESDADGAFYHTINNKADLDRKWAAILGGSRTLSRRTCSTQRSMRNVRMTRSINIGRDSIRLCYLILLNSLIKMGCEYQPISNPRLTFIMP